MFCSNCGTELPTGAQTCPSCGAAIARTPLISQGTPQNTDQIIAENPSPELQQIQSATVSLKTVANAVLVCEIVGRAIERKTIGSTFVGPGIIRRSRSLITQDPR